MAKDIKVQNTVYSKEEYNKVVDRNFDFYIQPTPVEEETTVEEFFELYENLYFEIPIKGATNSHEYLIQRSSELIDFEKDTEDIQPLLDEIAQLRVQLLSQQEQIIELTTQLGSE